MKTIRLAFCSIALSLPLQAGWIVHSSRIEYSAQAGQGFESFDMAVKKLADSGRIDKLDGIVAHALLADETLQHEVFAGLKRNSPQELGEALESAGNMHNPKMRQLWKPFEKAFLATPTIADLNASLGHYGLTSKPLMEKFELRKTAEEPAPRFHGFLWLVVRKTD